MHARTGQHACMRGQGTQESGRVGTHVAAAAQHWVQRQVRAAACSWQSTNKSRVNRPTDHG